MKNIFVTAVNVICKDGKFLLVRESKESAKGLYNFPAGKMEEGELIIETAVREALEETGLNVKPTQIVGIFQVIKSLNSNRISFVFKSEIISGQIAKSSDHPEVSFFTFDEIKELQEKELLRSSYVVTSIQKYLDNDFTELSVLEIVD